MQKFNLDKSKPIERLSTTEVTDSIDNVRKERIYSGIIFGSEDNVVSD
ncbi:MAG: hypothetical protein K9M99_12965 [Candidatus Cloacimonetes bacterium]|nr:hypothetical protein [Candidatus Cloacimonadota bacterium]